MANSFVAQRQDPFIYLILLCKMVSFGGMYIVLSTPTSSTRPNPFKKRILQKIMHIASDFLLFGLYSPKTFTLRNMPPTLSFCAEPKSEVAESIIRKITLDLRGRGDRPRRWMKDRQKHFLTLLIRSEGLLLLREMVFLCFLKIWILQLRASPACRMT